VIHTPRVASLHGISPPGENGADMSRIRKSRGIRRIHNTGTFTRPAERDTLFHLPAPRLRQAGRMGEGRGEGWLSRRLQTRRCVHSPLSAE
jgi:hypothetical protein